MTIELMTTETSSLEHWKGFQKSTKQTKKQLKHAAHLVVHPNKAREEERNTDKKAKQEENARSQYEEAQHVRAMSTASSSLKPEDVKDKALRERIEKMRKRKEEEDDQWRSGSQWRWEVITGRAQKAMKKKEQQWESAMGSVTVSTSKSKVVPDPGREEPLHPTRTVDPEATSAKREVSLATVPNYADSHHASDFVGTSAPSQAHREPGSGVPTVETVPEEGSPGTPKDRPPSYDNREVVTSPAEKSSSPM
jgi:hypothetical protein